MRSSKLYFFVTVITAGLVTGILPIFNIYTDFSRVLNKDYTYRYLPNRENLVYLKIAYLLDNQEDYDNLIVGSSRVHYGINTNTLTQELGGSWYKMEYPGGTPLQHFHNLTTLLYHGYRPQKIILTIDDFNLWVQQSIEALQNHYNQTMYPHGFRKIIDFYKFYLFKKPGDEELLILTGGLRLKRYWRIFEENSGRGVPASEDTTAHYEKLRKHHPFDAYAANIEYDYSKTIQYVSAIKTLCDKQQITLYIAFFPNTPKTLLARNHDSIESFKKELVTISEFYDFSGIHDITSDPSNWAEMSHFRTTIGDEIIKRITNTNNIPGIFGTLVTQKNIEDHITILEKGIISKIPELMESRSNIIISDSLQKKLF